jgi:hypothetical protein
MRFLPLLVQQHPHSEEASTDKIEEEVKESATDMTEDESVEQRSPTFNNDSACEAPPEEDGGPESPPEHSMQPIFGLSVKKGQALDFGIPAKQSRYIDTDEDEEPSSIAVDMANNDDYPRDM